MPVGWWLCDECDKLVVAEVWCVANLWVWQACSGSLKKCNDSTYTSSPIQAFPALFFQQSRLSGVIVFQWLQVCNHFVTNFVTIKLLIENNNIYMVTKLQKIFNFYI